MISLLHHAFAVYILCSFLFPYYKFNIIIIILTILGWIFNNNRCALSIYYNKICNIKESTKLCKYHLLNNQGYGTLQHRKSIKEYGLSEFHRKTFKINLNNI